MPGPALPRGAGPLGLAGWRHVLRVGLCLLMLAALWLHGAAQADMEVPPTQATAIEAARSTLENAELSQAQREAAQAQLEAAAALEKEAEPLLEQLAQLQEKSREAAAPAVAPLTAAERENQFKQWAARLPQSMGNDALEHLLREERNASNALKARIDALAGELTNLISRPGQRLSQMAALRQRADASAGEPASDANEPAALFEARRLRRAAEHRRALAELALYEAEQATAELRQRQLENQLQALRQEQALRAPRIEWLSQRISANSLQRLQTQAQELAALAESSAAQHDGALHDLAQRNAELAQQLLQGTQQLGEERRTLNDYEREREQIATALRDTQARLRLGSSSAATGYWLWQQRLGMPSLLALTAQRKQVQQRLAELRLQLYNATETRYAAIELGQAQPEKPAQAAQAGKAAEADGADEAAGQTAEQAAAAQAAAAGSALRNAWQATQTELIDQFEQLLRRRITVLEQTDGTLQTLLTRGDELRQLMDRQLLWTPSHPRVGQQWLHEWGEQGAEAIALTAMLGKALRFLLADLFGDPLPYLALALVLGSLLALRLRAPQRLRAISEQMRDVSQDRFSLTLQALLWTLLIALPGAVALWGAGTALQQVGARHLSDVEAIGRTMVDVSRLLLLTGLWGALVQPGGLAQAHFGWPNAQITALRRAQRLAMVLILPASFAAMLALHRGAGSIISTWGRLALVVLALGLMVLSWRLMRRLWPGTSEQAAPWLLRLLGWLLPAAFVAIALLALGGYIYTSTEMLGALFTSLTVVLAVLVVDGLLRRWLLLSERRLEQKRLLEQALSQGSASVVNTESGEAPPEGEAELTLVSISAQTHRLLRLLRLTLLALGLLWAWSEVLPALLRLDGVQLWGSSATGPDGKPMQVPVTLMDVLLGALLLLLTFSMARNLPGLLELALNSSRFISSATRYTLTTLLRYAITIAGVLLAFSLFGLRWSQLQWMAAALTVGLGFGLQEIFANFVSGLILLVERPFRVGDTVTIDKDLTGTVTRIRTRATTVLDYDNREIIIPNKTFITGQVTNWTLSDTVTRLVLNVGVAYGSDAKQVRQLLLRAADEHPNVLAEPAPNAWFMALGGSTLDFELRVYVATLGERMTVRNDLNRRITELLGEANIEIAFPQLDVHLCDLPQAAQQAVHDAVQEAAQEAAQQQTQSPAAGQGPAPKPTA
ncbi:mechanosensitive ion channel domain-containing protein [Vandammella animalimorsus]|uniref:mechanosensitive ion channel domain-containing protein n=1 Tax=Vandammella animalimorsus TaxID=2029117 RepID=UPI001EEE3E7B|nr:mechanosensitive ion channel domain-containing protein [Vandammella animalimorsus]